MQKRNLCRQGHTYPRSFAKKFRYVIFLKTNFFTCRPFLSTITTYFSKFSSSTTTCLLSDESLNMCGRVIHLFRNQLLHPNKFFYCLNLVDKPHNSIFLGYRQNLDESNDLEFLEKCLKMIGRYFYNLILRNLLYSVSCFTS